MKDYSFTAMDGEARIPYEFVLHDGKPVKLGDGTFGCVFHVRGRNQNCALKIFYESDDEYILKSQKTETEIGGYLRKHYIDDPAIEPAINSYLVAPIAYVDDFKCTHAYNSLLDYFTDLSFTISDRAIVMEFYPMSLKDLLERGWPTADSARGRLLLGRGAGGDFGTKPGYGVLEALPQLKREACILPIVQNVAEGLSILHGCDHRHQDVKPANVLIRQVGQNMTAAIADLGYIDTGNWQVHGSAWEHRPLGTRHYRSPEQTDYFDVCEVDVGVGTSEHVLTTRDPKFKNTFSEEGDFVVFSYLFRLVGRF